MKRNNGPCFHSTPAADSGEFAYVDAKVESRRRKQDQGAKVKLKLIVSNARLLGVLCRHRRVNYLRASKLPCAQYMGLGSRHETP